MNKKISHVVSSVILIVIVAVAGTVLWIQGSDQEDVYVPSQAIKSRDSGLVRIATAVPPSYAYLFESGPKEEIAPGVNRYGNIVGYFAGGAFGWYVPDWLVEKWEMKKIEGDPHNQGMIFSPKEAVLAYISDITMYVGTSTETFNAETLFENQKRTGVVMSEIVLNKHGEGGTTITMETNTLIYHIQLEDRGRMTDIYYINGHDKTLSVSFSSDEEYFHEYSAKIRDLVEGIGELKAPQG